MTLRHKDTLYKDKLDVRMKKFGTNHCILTVTVLLSKDILRVFGSCFSVINAIVTKRKYCTKAQDNVCCGLPALWLVPEPRPTNTMLFFG